MIAASGDPQEGVLFLLAVLVAIMLGLQLYAWRLRRTGHAADRAGVDGVDPGWRPAIIRVSRRVPNPFSKADLLTSLRVVVLAAVMYPVVAVLLLSVISPWSDGDVGAAPWIVVGAGLLSLIGIGWVRRRPLDMSTESGLAGHFKTAMFQGLGLALIPLLVGFVAALDAQSLWIYLVGLTCFFFDIRLIGPTRAEIARRQAQIMEAHLPHDLTRSLTQPRKYPR